MNRIVIGTVLKPQGIRGEVKIAPVSKDAGQFAQLKRITLSGETSPRRILRARIAPDFVFLAIEGIETRNDAELLRGKDVFAAREETAPLPEGRYYISDVIGCAVVSQGGTRYGEVADILQHGAADVYVVKDDKGELLFPAVAGVILRYDIVNKTVLVDEKRFAEVSCRAD